MTLVTRPSMVDDSGTFTDGTEVDEAFVDSLLDEIDDQAHSASNPTIKPKAITDEVVSARGSKATLDARLDVALEEDGTLKTQAGLASLAQIGTLNYHNLVVNSDLLLWPDGDAAAPYGFTLSGAGAAVARTGTGLGDTQKMPYGDFAAKITYGSATAKLTRTLLSTASFARFGGAKGRKIVVACKALSSVQNAASIVFDDGATTTRGGLTGAGTFHSGGGAVEWLYAVHTISQSATKLEFYLEVAQTGAAYFGDVLVCFGDIAPTDFLPTPMTRGTFLFPIIGTLSIGTKKFPAFIPAAPGIITDCQLQAETAPTSASLIVDINTWDGSAYTTAFTTKPTIVATAFAGNAAPDGTYARRCFRPCASATTTTAGMRLSVDVDQVGSGVAGADLGIAIRVRQYQDFLEGFRAYNEF